MIRIVRGVVEVRSWVQQRDGRPCRRPDGALDLNLPGEPCRGIDVTWGEFEPNFCVARLALAYDDAPGSPRWLLGGSGEVERFLAAVPAREKPPAIAWPPPSALDRSRLLG